MIHILDEAGKPLCRTRAPAKPDDRGIPEYATVTTATVDDALSCMTKNFARLDQATCPLCRQIITLRGGNAVVG